jgi:cytochrome c peroxidase
MRTVLNLGLIAVIAIHAVAADPGDAAISRAAVSQFVFDGKLGDALEFFKPHRHGNGRSCATCHRPEDNFALTPATVEKRYQALQARRKFDAHADDPLFRSLDADDFKQDFTTLRTRALVRVTLPLPANVKLADDPAATSVTLWRAVPTVMNARLTAPYQYDGHLGTLEDQARSAMLAHSELKEEPKDNLLERLSDFQRHLFSSVRVRKLAKAIEQGGALPEPTPPLTPLEQTGKATFDKFCMSCHGGPAQTVNSDARFLPVASRGPALGAQPFVNIFTQTPRPPGSFFAGVPAANLPQRSYLVTLPNGTLITVVTSDPGRGLISGDIRDFGRFDIPTLFGVSKTAPYFHDNSAGTLEDVINHYQAMFGFIEFLDNSQGFFAPPGPNGEGCAQGTCGIAPIPQGEIEGLLAFLKKL